MIAISTLVYFIYNRFTDIEYEGYLNAHYGQTTVIFGSSPFIGVPNILVVNNEPILKVAVYKNGILEEKLLINFIIFDASDRVVAKIQNDRWVINENSYFRLISSRNEIKVIDQLNEIVLDCIALPNGAVKVNGAFYINGLRIVITDTELKINT